MGDSRQVLVCVDLGRCPHYPASEGTRATVLTPYSFELGPLAFRQAERKHSPTAPMPLLGPHGCPQVAQALERAVRRWDGPPVLARSRHRTPEGLDKGSLTRRPGGSTLKARLFTTISVRPGGRCRAVPLLWS